jgi:PKD repeat protein
MKCEKGLQIAIPTVLCLLMVLAPVSALGVTGITPDHEFNTGLVFINNLSGTDFPSEADVLVSLNMTGEESIIGDPVTVASPTRITCHFDLNGRTAGLWDVYVINRSSGESDSLAEGFHIENPYPVVSSITPDNGENIAPVTITNLAGSNFLANATVNLTKNGQTTITATDVDVVSSSQITCEFNITYAAPGDWNVIVTNYDGNSDDLPNGFSIRYPEPVVDSIDPSSGTNDIVIGITNLAGTGFMPGANVTLRKAGQLDIPTINGPIVEANKILCFFDLNGAHVGAWDVVVTNLDLQEGVLSEGFTINYPDSPSVAGINPATGVNNGAISANVTGSGFHENATVRLSYGAQNITGTGGVVSPGSITGVTFDLTGMPAGVWDLTLVNEDGQSATLADAFTITNPPPTITSIDPTSGVNNGWIVPTMNITGTGFYATPTVTFTKGATTFNADSVTWESSTRLSCAVNLAGKEAGVYTVTVTNPDSLSSAPFSQFTIINPAPVIYSITPSTGENTGTIDILSLTGDNFLDGAVVNLTKVGETPIPGTNVAWVNSTTLTCTFDLNGKAAGVWSVEVLNPDGRSDTHAGLFTITNPPPSPQGIIPSVGDKGGPVGITALTGTGFLDGATVKLTRVGYDDIPGTSVDVNVTTQTIMCFFNLLNAEVGNWDVAVTNTDSQTGALEDGFFVRYPAAPVIAGISPSHGANDGVFTISDISGTGFQPGATVNLTMSGQDTIPGTNVVVTPTQISADFDLNGKQTGWWNVVVTNDDGQFYSYEGGFQVRYPAPTVTNITPAKGNNNQLVTITNLSGTNFRTGASVRLNSTLGSDVVADSVNVLSPTQIACTLNLAGKAVGAWNVIVTNSDSQSGTLPDGFTIEYPAPTVTAIDPVKASNDGIVVINSVTGTNFREGAAVWLIKYQQNEIVADPVHFIDSQTLNCTIDIRGVVTGAWTVAVINPDGKYGTLPMGFEVLPPAAIPNFTAAPTYGTVPLTVQFTDTSLNNPEFYGWNFGDGTIVVGGPGTDAQNPVHTYNEVGTYNVSLLVKNKGAPEGNLLRKDYLIVVVRTPVANFTGAPTYGNAPLVVQFEDHSQGDPQSWVWNFGDGSTSRSQNPYHLYTKPGVYTVTLTVSNRAGGDSMTKTDYITVRSLPLADFTANRTSGTAPMTVQFTDTSKGNPVSWAWSFGDGTTSTEQNPVHTYSAIGTYSVQLTVTNEAGSDTKTSPGYIMTEEGMQASFTFTTSNPENLAPLTVAFTDTSSGFYQRISWNFGDGYVSSEKNPIHTYTKPGNYTVTQTISDSRYGSTASQTIEVKQRFAAGFSVEPETGSAPLTVTLTDTSIGTPIAWQWWILNEDESVLVYIPAGENQEVYTIATPGNYSVMLDVTDSSGQIDVEKIDNCIHVLPFP